MRETIQNANGKQFHAVSLSGGKDSTAMLLLMIERGMPIDMVLSADTGILKILFAPLSLILSLFVWLCAGLLSCSGFVFKLASGLLSLLAIAVMITYSVKNGIILLVLAFLISPMGLPLLAVQGLGKLQDVNAAMKNFIHS